MTAADLPQNRELFLGFHLDPEEAGGHPAGQESQEDPGGRTGAGRSFISPSEFKSLLGLNQAEAPSSSPARVGSASLETKTTGGTDASGLISRRFSYKHRKMKKKDPNGCRV